MAGISIETALGGSSYGDSHNISVQSGAVTESRREQLERQISGSKQKLNHLDAADIAEKSKISAELENYESQLRKIENDEQLKENEKNEAERKRRFDSFECETCRNRRYQDVSDDPGVSFQSAAKINPAAAYSAVKAHENQHVARNKNEAERKGAKISYQTVTIHRNICPECGKSYVSGGVTKTVTKADMSDKYTVGMFDSEKAKGSALNNVA